MNAAVVLRSPSSFHRLWRRLSKGLLLVTLAGGCADYLPATTALAGSSAAAYNVLAPLPRTSAELCKSRAAFDLMQSRLDGTAPFGSEPSWSHWFDKRTEDADGGETWAQRCQHLTQADTEMRASAQMMAQYTALLQLTLQTGVYKGNGLKESAAAIGRGLAPFASTPAAVAGGMGDPLTQMANVVIQFLAKRRLVQTVKAADPLIAQLVAAQKKYLHVLDAQATMAEHQLGQMLDYIDHHAGTQKPLEQVALFDWGQRETARLRLLRDRLATFGRIIDALAASHHALAEAVSAGSARQRNPAMLRVAGNAATVQAEIDWLHEIVAQGGP
jgi:hypothetical protein